MSRSVARPGSLFVPGLAGRGNVEFIGYPDFVDCLLNVKKAVFLRPFFEVYG